METNQTQHQDTSHEHTPAMIVDKKAEIARLTAGGGKVRIGVLLWTIGIVICFVITKLDPRDLPLFMCFILIANVSFLLAYGCWASGKGRSAAWCLMALLGPLGVLFFLVMRNDRKARIVQLRMEIQEELKKQYLKTK